MSFGALGLQGKRVLFVASAGGHLSELTRLHAAIDAGSNSALVTFDSAQARSASWIDDIRFVPYVKPRDAMGTLRASRQLRHMILTERWDAVVSTGAAIAVSALTVASAANVRSIYIESYARFAGPSTTAKILEKLPGKYEFYTQHQSWARGEWRYTGSVMDALVQGDREDDRERDRYFVTLGTIKPYRFDALVDAVIRVLPERAVVVWQVGCTGRSDLPGRVYPYLKREKFVEEARRAEVVISHAGVGTAIELIEMGHVPVLVPRRSHRGEHVDDHQVQIAHDLAGRGLAITCDAADIDPGVLLKAAAT